MTTRSRKASWGPTWLKDGRVRFRLWASNEKALLLRLAGGDLPMQPVGGGWFEWEVDGLGPGDPYAFVLADGTVVPDPASRRQADLSGPSSLVDPRSYRWRHPDWKGRRWEEAVIYELHVGTFTAEGSFTAARERLEYLADIGFTAIELMPVAQFPGSRGWGYDGVFHFAPHRAYGETDDLKALIDAAHGLGMMVLLDVVYNHFGTIGNFLPRYAPGFFSDGEATPWGPRLAFEREPVRSYLLENALYWLEDFRIDGLRLDAVDQLKDESDLHILEELSKTLHSALPERQIHLITENSPNGTDLMAPREDGKRLYTADWNDDFHHALHSAVTGEKAGHYGLFADHPFGHTARALAQGYLRKAKPTIADGGPPPSALPATCFVHFLQNHDQVGNRARGDRLHTLVRGELYRALVELLCLAPQVPLFFMGDDHQSTRPFFFFADHEGVRGADACRDREEQANNFGGIPPGVIIPDPASAEAFFDSKLDWTELSEPSVNAWRILMTRLLRIRAIHIVPLLPSIRSGAVVASPDRCLFIDWDHGEGHLKLRANLSPVAVRLEPLDGERVYPEAVGAPRDELSAFSVQVSK